jgi:hypothetical protein
MVTEEYLLGARGVAYFSAIPLSLSSMHSKNSGKRAKIVVVWKCHRKLSLKYNK